MKLRIPSITVPQKVCAKFLPCSSHLADENDVFLCPTPGYNSYFQAGKQRWKFEVVSVPLDHKVGNLEATFSLSLERMESTLADLKVQGKNVRAFILNNPNNPLGIVLDRGIIEQIMCFCQREKIHLIADEMYCMSVFDKSTQFTSVLKIRKDNLLDAHLLHVIWGFSKDLRTGVLHTENQELQLKLRTISQYHAVPLPIMDMLANIISDVEWFQHYFVPKHLERMKTNHDTAAKVMELLGIPTTKTVAGFFFLADFRSYFNPCSEDKCKEFILMMYENGVYMTPGWEMRAEPGWFRIVFTCVRETGLNDGLQRLKKTLEQWKQEQSM